MSLRSSRNWSFKRATGHHVWPWVMLYVLTTAVSGWAQPPANPLPNFKPDKLIRFDDAASANARRATLVKAIWPAGLPTGLPVVSRAAKECVELTAIDKTLIDSVARFDIDISGFDWHADVYVLQPAHLSSKKRLAIVHGGHMLEGPTNYLNSGLDKTADHLLKAGYTVALAQMPCVAWNNDTTATVDGRAITIATRGSRGHSELFEKLEPELHSGVMRFFLEPVVQTINQYQKDTPQADQILMIGLSGGGWTTHMLAAVDPRIDVSLPVAGALPLYARPHSPGSAGDAEQSYAPIYEERDTDADGVPETATGIASWLEVFALGAIPGEGVSRPRRQIQVLNLYDTCCFNGNVYQSYSQQLTSLVDTFPNSHWTIFIDESHKEHIVSQHVLDQVLRDVIATPKLPASP